MTRYIFSNKIHATDSNNPAGVKENIPPIPCEKLLTPEAVVEKYPQLLKLSKLTILALRLAREAYFGTWIMNCCTVRGVGDLPALPHTQLLNMKKFLHSFAILRYAASHVEFETLWKGCLESIGQGCKAIRKNVKEQKIIL